MEKRQIIVEMIDHISMKYRCQSSKCGRLAGYKMKTMKKNAGKGPLCKCEFYCRDCLDAARIRLQKIEEAGCQ